MAVTYDPAKREWTLRERGLDFKSAAEVFAKLMIDIPDQRHDYANRGLIRSGTCVAAW